ncbi:DUF58 domain-containing protein [Solicola gregarius]|uniref:DUF58 domain-containing protein n=1 Tax=Solicola gregarius TaxID=2908642 RepID=A0AA46TKB2_9ACTN|nr:DUF58 domain-containing protein [Solicola gregarius]UYM06452.1 DUF58 domain-containing protein [Solicola gregarius]
MSDSRLAPWRPTHAIVRVTAIGFGGVLVAAAFGRIDLVVLAGPLLVVAVWAAWCRPTDRPAYDSRWASLSIREGETTRCAFRLDSVDHLDDAIVELTVPSFVSVAPTPASIPMTPDGSALTADVRLRSARWGSRTVGPADITASSVWDGFRARSGPFALHELITSPIPATFDSSAPMPHPVGLVGRHRSARRGDGAEFNSIRPFEVGDRLRRIHWPVSLRTGELHSITTWADQDAHVVLMVDGTDDIGISGGVDGVASSLDVTVRAAAAVAEQFLRAGDRVEVRLLDSRGMRRVPPSSGTTQLRRVLEQLTVIRPGVDARFDPLQGQQRLSAGATVVMLSPLIAKGPLAAAASLARSGLSIVVVDTLPSDVEPHLYDDRYADLAWRIRLLERQREVHRIQEVGVPVVPWRGPGSLDEVLRDLDRRAAAPRLARR